jgi:hypothetical protein
VHLQLAVGVIASERDQRLSVVRDDDRPFDLAGRTAVLGRRLAAGARRCGRPLQLTLVAPEPRQRGVRARITEDRGGDVPALVGGVLDGLEADPDARVHAGVARTVAYGVDRRVGRAQVLVDDDTVGHRQCRIGGELRTRAHPDADEYGSMPDPLSYRTLQRSLGAEPFWSIAWSPDSTRLLVHRLDQRHLPVQVLVESAPPDGARPREHPYRFPMLGDAAQATMTWAVLDLETGRVVRERGEPTTVMHATAMYYRWWSEKGDAVHFLHQSRDARTLQLRRLDPTTGETTTLITETGRTRVAVRPAPDLGLLRAPPARGGSPAVPPRTVAAARVGEIQLHDQVRSWSKRTPQSRATGDQASVRRVVSAQLPPPTRTPTTLLQAVDRR